MPALGAGHEVGPNRRAALRAGHIDELGDVFERRAALARDRDVERQHHRHGLVPPVQAAQVGLLARVVARGQVHACQHGADGGAVRGGGRQLALAWQSVHHGCGLALELVQDVAVAVGGGVRHRDGALRQVLHQVQVERQLLEAQPKDLTGRSRRQMTAYHNVLNVLGDRMRDNRNATVTLTGSSDQGAANGKALAEAVKSYLVNIFDIDEQRIKTEGRDKPSIPSFQPGGTREVELVRPEDRRVEITSSSVELLEPLQIISLQEDPLDSDVQLNAIGAENSLASWSIEVSDDAGNVKRYGPFTTEHERVSGRAILGDKLQGQYKIALVGETKNGQSLRREESVKLVRTDQPDEDLGLRFSILFEFDQSKTVATYERFLTGTVAPLIPDGASVTIHGHTDVIGEESHNLKLSRDRANETQNVIERALSRAGKRRVKFDTYGFGEDVRRAPFENRLPEERFYNRTVIIDIVPE